MDNNDDDDPTFPRGGLNTFEPGQGLGQEQRRYQRAANRSSSPSSNGWGSGGGNFGSSSSSSSSSSSGGQRQRGRMSGFNSNGMGMGMGMGMGGSSSIMGGGRSGGRQQRQFGEESGSMTFTETPDGGRCFLT
jgi:hypothetical protein